MQPQTAQPDLQALALTKAIRQKESGGNYSAVGDVGTSTGAYQYQAGTWKGYAKQILGNQDAPMTPENQNAVTYGMIKSWKEQGLGPAQIAAKWNSGQENGWENKIGTTTINGKPVPYNVPQYVSEVVNNFKQIYPQVASQYGSGPNNLGGLVPSAEASMGGQSNQSGGPMFPYQQGDSGLTAGLKALGNTPGSAIKFGEGVVKSALPTTALDNISQIGSGFQDLAQQEGTGKAVWDIIKGLPAAAYHTLVPRGVQNLLSGDTQGAAKEFTNDPFGQTAPIVLGAQGAAKLADLTPMGKAATADMVRNQYETTGLKTMPTQGAYSQAFDNGISSVGGGVAGAVGTVATAPLKLARSVVSNIVHLPTEIMVDAFKNPDTYSKLSMEATNRASVAEDFSNAVDKLIADKQSNGAEYQAFHTSPTSVTVPPDFIANTLRELGLEVAKDGKVTVPTTSQLRPSPADVASIQKFADTWGNKQVLTSGEVLNMRHDTNVILKAYSDGKSSASKVVGKKMYDAINTDLRPQVQGLKELDTKVSPQLDLFGRIKKDFLNADGTFKDGAASKIVNSLNKEPLLARMEQVAPGITKSIELVKAMEALQKEFGAGQRQIIRGAEAVLTLTGHIPEVLALILTNPKFALQIVRGFGYTAKTVTPIINALGVLTGQLKTTAGPAANIAAFNAGTGSQTNPQQPAPVSR